MIQNGSKKKCGQTSNQKFLFILSSKQFCTPFEKITFFWAEKKKSQKFEKYTKGRRMSLSGPTKRLIQRPLLMTFSDQEEARLLENLREDREKDVVSKYGLTPEQLPDLIKYNPNIAFECLLNLCKTKEINQ